MGTTSSKVNASDPSRVPATGRIASALRPDAWAELNYQLSGGSYVRTRERIQCICEGGQDCRSEDPSYQLGQTPFDGLHASWVTPQVLAMARPWQENLLKHKIPQEMQAAGVGMILNLQEAGEHAHCGRGILAVSGFSYDPETFMSHGIGVYNFSWRDMGVPTLHKMMDIVQVMVHVTEEEHQKVAVHCHAGLGRTGLAIACYLVFLGNCDAHEAVTKVRQGRPGALQTHQQEHFVEIFQAYLMHLRCIFQTPQTSAASSTAVPSRLAAMQPAGGGQRAVESHAAVQNDSQQVSQDLHAASAAQLAAAPASQAVDSQVTAPMAAADPSPAEDQLGSHQTGLSSANQHRLFRPPWRLAKHGQHSAQVHAIMSPKRPASKSGALWNEDGFIRAGSSYSLHKRQPQRASPPSSLQEALMRQRRLLHGAELRQYWDIPKVVELIASALEHAVDPTADGSPKTARDSVEDGRAAMQRQPLQHDVAASSVAEQLQDFVVTGCSMRSEVDAITEQVNSGKWDLMRITTPIILMQLLQKSLQDLAEPVLPASQLKDLFGSSCSASSHAVHNADTVDQSAADLVSQKADAEQHAAIVSKFTQLQRALIARLVRCFRLVSEHCANKKALEDLMRWLAKALTLGPGHHALSSETAEQLTALQSFLICCDVHLLHAKPAYQQEPAATQTEPTQPDANILFCQVSSQTDERQSLQRPYETACTFPGNTEQSQSLLLIKSEKSDRTLADASEPMTAEEHGCLWLHMRMAKRAFGAVNMSPRGPVMAARS